jgi:UDP-N-acetylmuramyl pentapeptide phosphotransferase/UDP-N-acetylglucosamine-1-phosphate transferase
MISLVIIRLFQTKNWVASSINDIQGVQNFHQNPTARLGGVVIFMGWSFGLWLLQESSNFLLILLLTSLPVFTVGLIEDVTAKVPPMVRLISAFISITLAYLLLDIGLFSLGIELVDYLLSYYLVVSLLLTLVVVGGAVNSLNIIDGFNGLMSGYSILASLAIAYVSHSLGDDMVVQLSLILTVSIFGFFVFNFPFGKIFMGDGGAYFIGFILAIIGLMLVSRHKELSNWFVLLIFIYPMYELLYSIYRRKIIHKTDASQPDTDHLHSLIYRKLISCDRFKHDKVICNSMTSPFLWLLSLVGIVPAVIWYDNQTVLIISAFVFMFIYTIIYKYIASDRFKFNH